MARMMAHTISGRALAPFALALAVGAAAWTAAPAARAADEALYSQKFLTLEAATELAQAALKACRTKGYQVAVTVVDRGGLVQITLRDRFAGLHTIETAYRKAWTALSFRTNTTELSKLAEKGEMWAIRGIPQALPLGGGVIIREGGGSLIGAVGVSGAPGPSIDEECGKAGIAAIEDKISF
ncbi:MAG: heme-binding protein [Beijerinckiaceae bacterium]